MTMSLNLAALALILTIPAASASASTVGDTSHVRPNGQICVRVPRGPDEWYSGPPYRIVCHPIARPAGLPPVRR